MFTAKEKSTTFLGESLERIGYHFFKYALFNDDHGIIFLMTSLYLSALSGRSVTIMPRSILSDSFIAPARLAAEEGLSKRPSSFATLLIISYDSSVLTSMFSSARFES